jgi:hypothetical protein
MTCAICNTDICDHLDRDWQGSVQGIVPTVIGIDGADIGNRDAEQGAALAADLSALSLTDSDADPLSATGALGLHVDIVKLGHSANLRASEPAFNQIPTQVITPPVGEGRPVASAASPTFARVA